MKNIKKMMAFGLATAMVFGSTLTAFAADTQVISSSGAVAGAEQTVDGTATENYVNKKVFKLEVPTKAAADKIFSFYTDPLGLIAETEGVQVVSTGAIVEENQGILFVNRDEEGNVAYLSGTSDSLNLVNKSSSGVEISVKARLKPGASDPYQGGTAKKIDFSATSDGALYIGLMATGEPEMPLEIENNAPTSPSAVNVVLSAADLYHTVYTGGAYSYDLYDDVEEFPTYSFSVRGALDLNQPDSTWFKTADDSKPLANATAVAMPDIELKYTPTYIDARQAAASFDGANVYAYKADGTGFGFDTAVSDIKVSGKAVSGVTATDGEDGTAPEYVTIPVANIYTAFGWDYAGADDEEKAEMDELIWECVTGVQFTVDGVTYYANIAK